jgi:hypothetical protein
MFIFFTLCFYSYSLILYTVLSIWYVTSTKVIAVGLCGKYNCLETQSAEFKSCPCVLLVGYFDFLDLNFPRERRTYAKARRWGVGGAAQCHEGLAAVWRPGCCPGCSGSHQRAFAITCILLHLGHCRHLSKQRLKFSQGKIGLELRLVK